MKIKRVVTLVIAASFLFNSITGLADKSPKNDDIVVNFEYVVQKNDTLWDIAQRNYPGQNPKKIVAMIKEENNIKSVIIHEGQTLLLRDVKE